MRHRSAFHPVLCVFWLALAACALCSAVPSRAIVNPTAGLSHHWAFDESTGLTAADSAGAQPGTLVNGPVWQPALGMFPGALEFDGVDDYVSLGTMDAPAGTGLTIGMWIKADDFDVTDGRLISKSTGLLASDHYWMVSTINSTGLRFRLRAGGSTTTLATSTGAIGAGKWYHVAVTYDGATMRIYKDGVEAASAPKAGAINSSAAVGVAIGNQPAGAGSAPFDGLIDDVRVYNRALTPQEVSGMAGDPKITLWYGDSLAVGELGVPQKWANVLGTVTGAARVDSLYYRLNGGAASQLTVGPDGYRLVGEGDFNIELDYGDLNVGTNQVAITSVDVFGQRSDTTVTVTYMNGVKWARPDTLKFESASRITDEACIIDGKWHLEDDGVRNDADAIGYDRLLTAGEGYDAASAWPSDLDVTAPITIHAYVDMGGKRGAVGIGLGWQGHNGPEQPAKGHKYQAIAFVRDVTTSPILTLYKVSTDGYVDALKASTPVNVQLGVRYVLRMRSVAFTPDSSHVYAKIWEDGMPEPISWTLSSNFATINGSVLLISHYAETTFGNTVITPLTLSAVRTRPPSLVLAQNAPNPFDAATTIRYSLSETAPAQLEVYDVLGRRVHHAAIPSAGPGWYDYRLDATRLGGRPLPAGVYFYTLRALGVTETRKMVVVR